jgi:hypothetical protein
MVMLRGSLLGAVAACTLICSATIPSSAIVYVGIDTLLGSGVPSDAPMVDYGFCIGADAIDACDFETTFDVETDY